MWLQKWCKARNGAGGFVCLNAVNGGAVIDGGIFYFCYPVGLYKRGLVWRIGDGDLGSVPSKMYVAWPVAV